MVFSWEGDLPADSPPGITLAGEEVDGVFERGFECYGIPIGTDNYVKYKLKCKAGEIVTGDSVLYLTLVSLFMYMNVVNYYNVQ